MLLLPDGVASGQQPQLGLRIKAGRVKPDDRVPVFQLQVDHRVLVGILHHSQLLVRHEVLREAFHFVGLHPGEIRLIVGKHAAHQLYVRSVFVGQVTIPGLAKISVTPRPLLLSRSDVMAGNVHQASVGVMFVTAHKIILAADRHVGGGHGNVLVPGNIYSGGVVYLIIGAGSYREARYVSFPVIEYGMYVGWENRLIVIIDRYRRIGPPEKGLGEGSAIV